MEQERGSKSKYAKVGPGPFQCISCLEEKDKKEFSRKQILKEEKNCRSCVDKIVQIKKEEDKDKDKDKDKDIKKREIPFNVLCYNCKRRGHKKSECIKKGGGAFNPGGMKKKMK